MLIIIFQKFELFSEENKHECGVSTCYDWRKWKEMNEGKKKG